VSTDATKFGSTADALVGRAFTASLDTNSLKLTFDPDNHRHEYIWIDPPWALYHDDNLAMSSSDYSESSFKVWAGQLVAARSAEFLGWSVAPDFTTIFELDRGYRLVLPPEDAKQGEDSFFAHWFAAEPAA
jgi:hypothetical protein